eukprot:267572_1
MVNAVVKAIDSAGPYNVLAMCIDTTCCTVVALDSKGYPLRSALMWMDTRSSKLAKDLSDKGRGDPALVVNGGGNGLVSAEWLIPKAMYLKENELDVYSNSRWIVECQDYLNYKLCGRMVASQNNAITRWHYRTGFGWPKSLLCCVDMEDLLLKWPEDVLPMGAIVGGLTEVAASDLRLPPGLPVIQGGADSQVALVGLGVCQKGDMALITGSSHLQLGLCDKMHGIGYFGSYDDSIYPGISVIEGGQTSTGSILAWFEDLVSLSASELDIEAESVLPGAEGLLVQDHFAGNRTPYTDAGSRGAIVGLSLAHSRAHIWRALLEGIALGTDAVLECLKEGDFDPRTITVAGGATQSDLWLSIHSDIANRPLRLTKGGRNAGCLGCAILAAYGVGKFDTLYLAIESMVETERWIYPNPEMVHLYDSVKKRYSRMYEKLRPLSA